MIIPGASYAWRNDTVWGHPYKGLHVPGGCSISGTSLTATVAQLGLKLVAGEPPAPLQLPALILNTVECTDLFDLMARLPEHSVDMILADLPYGTTACSWDEVIPFEPMWAAFKRVIKPRGAIVLTGSQPFSAALIVSNIEMFKYEWVWNKSMPSGFLHAANSPLKVHENILVFSPGIIAHANLAGNRMNYFPQMSNGKPYTKLVRHETARQWANIARPSTNHDYLKTNDGDRFPASVLDFSNSNHNSFHPTQKPVALFEYLIRTYTQPGDLVVDPVVGSGTTAIAARNTGRRFYCGDQSEEYVTIARERLAQPYTPSLLPFAVPTPAPVFQDVLL